jgi:hypothetical protein
MRATLSLHVPQPCTQPWADMTPQGTGRHCAACQKVVVDFTRKTDAEILAMLRAATGQTCGRFGADQLRRPLQAPLMTRPAWWQTAMAATVALLSFRTLAPASAHGQSQPGSVQLSTATEAESALTGKIRLTQSPSSDPGTPTILTGLVLDKQTGESLPGVTVMIEGTTQGVVTNLDGTFSLPMLAGQEHLPLVFSSVGYVSLGLPQPKDNAPLRVQLSGDVKGRLGKVVVTRSFSPLYTPRGFWQRLRSIPRRVQQAFQPG